MQKSSWRSCKNDKPVPYIRIEIKDKNSKRHIGFYIGNGIYLETIGKEEIKSPHLWRYLKRPDETWDGFKFGWMFATEG